MRRLLHWDRQRAFRWRMLTLRLGHVGLWRARSGLVEGTGFTDGFAGFFEEYHGFFRAGVGVAPGLTLGAFERLRHLAQFSSMVPRSIL